MRKWIGIIAALFLLSATSFAEVTKEDLQRLAAAGISDGVVLAYIRSHGPVPKLSAQDLIELKNAGVSNNVLERIAAGEPESKVEPPVANTPVRTEVIERQVPAVSPPTVVYVPSAWYSPWRPCRPWLRVGWCW